MPCYLVTIDDGARLGPASAWRHHLGPMLATHLRADKAVIYHDTDTHGIVGVFMSPCPCAQPYLCKRLTALYPWLKTGNRYHTRYRIVMQTDEFDEVDGEFLMDRYQERYVHYPSTTPPTQHSLHSLLPNTDGQP